jgi:hypothetical protein
VTTCRCINQVPIEKGTEGFIRKDGIVHTRTMGCYAALHVLEGKCPDGCQGIAIGDGNFSGCACSGKGCDCPHHPLEAP